MLHEWLREAMRVRGWNVPRLAEAADVSIGLAAKWVSDNPRYRVTPSPVSCEKIADALGVEVDAILSLAGHRRSDSARPRISAVVDAELQRRTDRLQALINAGYPKATLLSVLDANIRMAEMAAPQPTSNPVVEPVSNPVPNGLHGEFDGPESKVTTSFALAA